MLLPVRRIPHISRHEHANDDDIAYTFTTFSATPIPNDDDPSEYCPNLFPICRQRGTNKNVPRMKPTTPLMRSKTLAMRSRPRPKTDWMAERMPLRMPERISKREEKRFEMPFVREDIVDFVFVFAVLESDRVLCGEFDKCGYGVSL